MNAGVAGAARKIISTLLEEKVIRKYWRKGRINWQDIINSASSV
jgi:hypothetical protein